MRLAVAYLPIPLTSFPDSPKQKIMFTELIMEELIIEMNLVVEV